MFYVAASVCLVNYAFKKQFDEISSIRIIFMKMYAIVDVIIVMETEYKISQLNTKI